MIDVDALLDGVQSLPASPYPLPELSKALTDPNADLNRVVEIISFDPALTAKLLQLCNSAAFSRGNPANDVAQAVNRLGFQTVYRALTALKGPQIFPKPRTGGIDPVDLWTHSVMTAIAAQVIAEDLGEESGFLFTAGLLHDLGKAILGEKADYAGVVQRARNEHQPLHQMETTLLGADHAKVGARLLERWNFSPEMVDSVRFHHHPEQAERSERFAAVIQVASACSHKKHPDRGQRGLVFDAASGIRILGWQTEDLERYSERLNENEALARAMLRMGAA